MQIADSRAPRLEAAAAAATTITAAAAEARRIPVLARARRTSLVRAELALLERATPQPLTIASRRPQALTPGRGVAPVRPLGRSLRIVHLAAAHERLSVDRRDRPRLVR